MLLARSTSSAQATPRKQKCRTPGNAQVNVIQTLAERLANSAAAAGGEDAVRVGPAWMDPVIRNNNKLCAKESCGHPVIQGAVAGFAQCTLRTPLLAARAQPARGRQQMPKQQHERPHEQQQQEQQDQQKERP